MTLLELVEAGSGRYLSWLGTAAASFGADAAFYVPSGASNVVVQVASSASYYLERSADPRAAIEAESATWFPILAGPLAGSRQTSVEGPATAIRVRMVSGTAQVSVAAQSEIPREHSVWLNFGSGWEEITSYLYGRLPVSRSRSIHNDLRPVVSTATFTLDRGSSIANRILAASGEIEAKILKNGESYFLGTVRKTIKIQISQTRMESIKIQCVDAWLKLDKKKPASSVSWQNFAISNPATPSASILHQLFLGAGFAADDVNLAPIAETIDWYSIDATTGTTYRALIEELLLETGYSAYVDESGIVQLYDLAPESITESWTLTTGRDGTVGAPYDIERMEERYRGASAEWTPHETLEDATVFEDRTNGTSSLSCSVALAAGGYYPEGAEAGKSVRAAFAIQDYEIVGVASPTLEWSHTGDVVCQEATVDGSGMMLRFFSATGGSITKLKIVGDAIVKGDLNKVVYEIDPGTTEIDTVRLGRLHSKSAAERLAILRSNWHAYSDFRYSFMTTETAIQPGSIVRLTDSAILGVDVWLRVVQVQDGSDPKQIALTCEGLTEYVYSELPGATETGRPGAAHPTWQARLDYAGGQAQAAAQSYALGLSNALRAQVDRQVQTHEDVAPYSDPSTAWTTDELRRSHHWDYWHKAGDGGDLGTWWKWVWVEAVSTGSWIQVTDGPELYALNAAYNAQLTADSKSTTWESKTTAEAGGAVVGDTYPEGGILYRCTSVDPYAWARVTPKRHPDGTTNPTTDLVANDTFYDTDDYQWRIFQGGSWVDDGPPMTPEGIGAVTTATAPRYLGRYEAAHPTSKNSGDWWTVYDDDTGDAGRPGNGHPERGIWWLDGSTSRRIDGASTMAEQAKLVAALGDVSWAERNGYGESADYDIDVLLEAIAATTAFLQTLYAQEIILSTDGYIKSSNYAETGGLPTAGFKLDHATNTISAYAAKFVNATISGKASLREVVIADVTPGSYVAKDKSYAWPGLTTNSTSYLRMAALQFAASGEVGVYAETSGSSTATEGYIKVDRYDKYDSYVSTVMESLHTGTGKDMHGQNTTISQGDWLYVYIKSSSVLYEVGLTYIAIKIAEKPGILPFLGS